jgi:hypothetical protein
MAHYFSGEFFGRICAAPARSVEAAPGCRRTRLLQKSGALWLLGNTILSKII